MQLSRRFLFHPKNAIPVDLEPDNVLFVIPIDDVVAVFRKTKTTPRSVQSAGEAEDADNAEE